MTRLVSFDAECGMLSVPFDYSQPRGEKIQLAVSRVRHTVPDDQYQGIMLVNPGGPGGSGLDLLGVGCVRARATSGRATTGSGSTREASAPACPR